MKSSRLTDAEWREFQNMPEEGVSHRGCDCCQGRCSCGGAHLGPDKRRDEDGAA